MGFGILFIGYIVLFICRAADVFPDILGYGVMLCGMFTLARNSAHFAMARNALIPTAVVGLLNDVLQIITLVNGHDFGALRTTVVLLNLICLAGWCVLFCFGVVRLSNEIHLPKLRDKAKRNIAVTALYLAATVVTTLRPSCLGEFIKYFSPLMLVVSVLWTIFGATLIYGCYMHICLEGDEEMPDRPSRFGFPTMRKKDDEAESDVAQPTAATAVPPKKKKRRK